MKQKCFTPKPFINFSERTARTETGLDLHKTKEPTPTMRLQNVILTQAQFRF
jgi:hypothetical protein